MTYEQHEEAIAILRDSRKYLQSAHDEAQDRHDSYGEDYMSDALYEIMLDTEALIRRIDVLLAEDA